MYDTIVLSNSITGLAIAALLVNEGMNCCLIGDYTNYKDCSCFPFYYYDAIQGSLGYVLKKLNITKLKVIKQEQIDRAFFPHQCIERPADWRIYGKQLSKMFPQEAEEIDKYINLIEQLSKEWNGILQGKLIFTPKDVPNCVKYFSVSYAHYIQEHFKSEQLKGILCIGIPNGKVALSVMAGYLGSQVFDACFIEGGMKNIFESIDKSVDMDRLAVTSKEFKMDVINDIIEVKVGLNNIVGKVVIDTRGEDQYLMKDLSDLTYISIMIKDSPLADKLDEIGYYLYDDYDILKAMDNINNGNAEWYPVHIWNYGKHNLLSDKETIVRVDITCKKSDNTDYADVISKAVNMIKKYFPQMKEDSWSNMNIEMPDDLGKLTGFHNGLILRWAFSTKNIMKNPMKIIKSNNVINIDDWGGAWFSSAIVAYLEVKKLLERRD